MLSAARKISDLKMNAYAKMHIPTKDEVMDEIIAIGKVIADSLEGTKPWDDVYALFIENNNRDLEFYGFLGDGAGTIDCEGNLVHIGDAVALTCKGWCEFKQCAIRILPKQKTIYNYNGRVVKSYKEFLAACKKDSKGIFSVVSCFDAYVESISQSDSDKGNEGVV